MDMYYYVLHVINLYAMATMYMVNFANKLQKSEEKVHPLSHIYTNWSQVDSFGIYV